MTPSLALAYLFWTRHRRGLTLVGGSWLAAMLLFRTVPAGVFAWRGDLSLPPGRMVFIFLISSMIVAAEYLVMVFTFAKETRLEACASGFPARLWPLPLPTHALVGWPMLWGSAAMILGWMTLAWAARPSLSFDVPLVWPGLLLAAVLAWLQALLWTPFPLSWVRAFLLIALFVILAITWAAITVIDTPSAAVCGLLAIALLAAYGTTIRSVGRARRGDTVQWGWPAWLRAARMRPPFVTAAQAQLWLEWRLHGFVLPLLVACFAGFWLPCTPPVFTKIPNEADRGKLPFALPPLLHELGSLWLTVIGLMIFILFVAWAFGITMGRLGWKSYRLSSFLATRPVSEAMLVRAKFVVAAWNTLAGWGVLAIALLLWLALDGHAVEMLGPFEAMRQWHPAYLFWGRLVLIVGVAVVLTWLEMVQRMWIGLTGNTRLIATWGFCSFVAFIGLIVFAFWLAFHSEYLPVLDRQLSCLAGPAVLLKSLAAGWSLSALRRRGLIPSGVLWGMLAIWLAVAIGLFVALYALLPDDWFSVSGVVLAIMLLLPLTRLALAPVALSWNRHQ